MLFLALALLCVVSPCLEALGAGVFRIVLRDGSELVGAVRSFEDGIYDLSLPGGDKAVAAADVQRIDVVQAGVLSQGPLSITPEFHVLVGEQRFVVGRLRSFEDGIYEIETRLGPIKVPVADIRRIDVSWIAGSEIAGVKPAPRADPATDLAEGLMRFAGSNVIGETLLPTLLEAYAKRGRALSTLWVSGAATHEQKLVAVAPDGKKLVAGIDRRETSAALEALANGSADVGMMSRQMSPEELTQVAAAAKPRTKVKEHVVALGGVVVLVHPSNPIKSLRLDQIADIFSGRVRNWSELGGAPRRIRVIAPPEGSGILEVFRARVLRRAAISPLAARVASSTELSGLVGSDPTAIGLTEFAYVRNAAALAITDGCGLTHAPSEFSIQTEEYPLSGRLYLYTKESAGAEVKRFIDFALSAPAQKHVRELGHVSRYPILASQGIPIERAAAPSVEADDQQIMAQLTAFLASARRLSVTFRFASASSLELDARGTADLARLVEYLGGDARQGRRVALLGFSDGAGGFASNVRLAERRAQFVAQKLKDKGVTVDRAFGFGPLLPVACEATPGSVGANRRVEVWLY